jgi:hypothetical protein
MAHKDVIGIFFDGANTIITYLDICDLYDSILNDAYGTNIDQPKPPYSLHDDWRTRIAPRVMDDILYDYPQKDKIHDLIVNQDSFKLIQAHSSYEEWP